jgi:hypothetical protein
MFGATEWMEGAAEDGGLLVPGNPAKHGCDLILRSGQVEVHAGEEEGAALAWEEFDSVHRPLDDARDRWRFAAYAVDDSGISRAFVNGTGVGVEVEGRCRVVTLPVIAARDTRRNRFNRSMSDRTTVPLAPWSRQSPRLHREARVLDALTALLAERPDLRARLDDPPWVTAVAERLQDDLPEETPAAVEAFLPS